MSLSIIILVILVEACNNKKERIASMVLNLKRKWRNIDIKFSGVSYHVCVYRGRMNNNHGSSKSGG